MKSDTLLLILAIVAVAVAVIGMGMTYNSLSVFKNSACVFFLYGLHFGHLFPLINLITLTGYS